MKVLVTGGAGFIGSHLVEELIELGHTVIIIDNLYSGSEKNIPKGAFTYYYSVTQAECEQVFEQNDIDVVVHLAAQVDAMYSVTHVSQDAKINILGLVNILEISQKHGVKRVVFASSAAVYGDNTNIPLGEDNVLDPMSPYGMDKMIGERYCDFFFKQYGLSTIALRFANVYGPRQSYIGEGGVISIFLSKMKAKESLTVFGDGSQTRDFIFVKDIVKGIICGMTTMENGVYNIGTGTETSLNQIIEILKEDQPLEVVNKDFKKGDIRNSVLDSSLAERELGFSVGTDLRDGLQQTLKWYSHN